MPLPRGQRGPQFRVSNIHEGGPGLKSQTVQNWLLPADKMAGLGRTHVIPHLRWWPSHEVASDRTQDGGVQAEVTWSTPKMAA